MKNDSWSKEKGAADLMGAPGNNRRPRDSGGRRPQEVGRSQVTIQEGGSVRETKRMRRSLETEQPPGFLSDSVGRKFTLVS